MTDKETSTMQHPLAKQPSRALSRKMTAATTVGGIGLVVIMLIEDFVLQWAEGFAGQVILIAGVEIEPAPIILRALPLILALVAGYFRLDRAPPEKVIGVTVGRETAAGDFEPVEDYHLAPAPDRFRPPPNPDDLRVSDGPTGDMVPRFFGDAGDPIPPRPTRFRPSQSVAGGLIGGEGSEDAAGDPVAGLPKRAGDK
jgi:hypothetical protein